MLLKSVLIASSLVTGSLALASPHDGHDHHHDSHSGAGKDDKAVSATTVSPSTTSTEISAASSSVSVTTTKKEAKESTKPVEIDADVKKEPASTVDSDADEKKKNNADEKKEDEKKKDVKDEKKEDVKDEKKEDVKDEKKKDVKDEDKDTKEKSSVDSKDDKSSKKDSDVKDTKTSSSSSSSKLFAGNKGQTNYLGFNSGNTNDDWSHKTTSDFEDEFMAAKSLAGTNGQFTSVRLFSCLKMDSDDEMTPAFEAAVKTNTSILLGVWASGGKGIDGEIGALKKAIKKWDTKFTDLLIGVSIGSEDLYRNSEDGKKNEAGPGTSADKIVDFIKTFKKEFSEGPVSKLPIGHVDVWKAWKDPANKAVIQAVDWIGLDDYTYYHDDMDNYVTNASDILDKTVEAVEKASKDAAGTVKPIWLTEIGWPVSGPQRENGVPSVKNAKYFWDDVGCRKLFNKVPTFWYILKDSNPQNKVKFAITEKDNLKKPKFDLGCPAGSDSGFDSNKPASTGPPDVDMRAAASSVKLPGALLTVLALVVGVVAWV
ncbi:hypothetical protein CP533_0289 [Ophiocordyceps camponoti-saundersi (nom. inval.)]|nr:hypothetical protein CP533_0289 [Ophiocordyceps camponoti-saundersi (nom. inval.)]